MEILKKQKQKKTFKWCSTISEHLSDIKMVVGVIQHIFKLLKR